MKSDTKYRPKKRGCVPETETNVERAVDILEAYKAERRALNNARVQKHRDEKRKAKALGLTISQYRERMKGMTEEEAQVSVRHCGLQEVYAGAGGSGWL